MSNNISDLNQNKWDRRSENYDHIRFHYFRIIQKAIVKLANISDADFFLDIGCATGWAVCYASAFAENGFCFGIDISPNMIEKAKRNSKLFKNTEFIVANAENLPFHDGMFDKIICTNSFHHYQNPQKVLNEINRVLHRSGSIYILDPTSDNVVMKVIDKMVRKREKEHIKFYQTEEYKNMYQNANLSYIKTKRILGPLKVHIAVKI
jgi:ubiquinone/menaquinone biosynthesis C-methylase UbiE